MTAIAGFIDKKKGITYLAADTMGSNGFTGQMFRTEKLFRKEALSVAYCGSYRLGQVLKNKLNPRKMFVEETDDDYVHGYLVDHFMEIIEKAGRMKNDSGIKTMDSAEFIVAFKDRLFVFQSDNALLEAEKHYIASGSGEYHVYACLDALSEHSKLSPKEILKKAIEISSRYVMSVGDKVNIIEHKHTR